MARKDVGSFSIPVAYKREKGLVLRYIEHITGYSRQHVSKLVHAYIKTGHIRVKTRRRRQGFQSKYSHADIAALAEVDQAIHGASGTTIKALCQREFNVYGKTKFKGIAGVSVSHLYRDSSETQVLI